MRSGIKVGISNALVNLITLINGVLFLSFLSRQLTIQDFAKWSWINSTVSLIAISDLYLTLYLQNTITRNFAKRRKRFAEYLFRNIFYLQLIFALIIIAVVFIILVLLSLLGIIIFDDNILKILFIVALSSQLLSQPTSIYGAYFAGKGDSDISNFMLLCKAIGQNILFASVLISGFTFFAGGVIYFMSGLFFLVLYHKIGEEHFQPYLFTVSVKSLKWTLIYLKQQAKLFTWGAVRIIDAIRNNIPVVAGYFFISSISLVDYVFITRLNTIIIVIAAGFFSTLSARILTMKTKLDLKGLRSTIAHTLNLTIGIGIVYSLAMMFGAEYVTSIWSGRSIEFESVMILMVALSGVAQIIQSLMWNIVLGLDNVSILCNLSLGACLATVLTLILLYPNYGVAALPIATLIGSLVFISYAFIKIKIYLNLNKTFKS
jgi:O-antigen/teichoic acid export membrane protein